MNDQTTRCNGFIFLEKIKNLNIKEKTDPVSCFGAWPIFDACMKFEILVGQMTSFEEIKNSPV